MRFRVFIEKKAHKQLEKFDEETREYILNKVRELKQGFSSRLDIKKLRGYKNHYRLRVGDYRILFEMENYKIIIYAILPREKAYKRD